MSSIDVERLTSEISGSFPCGEDVAYDPANVELERAIQGTPEQQVGDQVIEAQEPDWRAIKSSALELLDKGKDLRVITYLTLAAMRLEGLPGLRDGIKVLAGVIEKYWDEVFPLLDPDDNNDPMERMNIISSLAPESSFGDPVKFPQRLIEVPLVHSAQLGTFSYRHVMIANGEIEPSGDEPAVDQAQIDAAFATGKDEEITENAAAITEIQELLEKLDSTLGEKVGAANVPNLDKFMGPVKQIKNLFDQKASGGGEYGGGEAGGEGEEGAGGGGGAAAGKRGPGLGGTINSRGEVLKALDLITNYYRKHEPSSPVPLLMQRARRLVEKNFVEIMQDMSPDSMTQLQTILGYEEGASSDE